MFQPLEPSPSLTYYLQSHLLVGRATVQIVGGLSRILKDYYLDSCQKVNLFKSAMHFNPWTPRHSQQMITDKLGINEHTEILQHVGVPISGGRLRRVDCGLVERVIQNHLEGWQAHVLSMMGWVTLMSSVLSSILSIFLLLPSCPKTWLSGLCSISRYFCRDREGAYTF